MYALARLKKILMSDQQKLLSVGVIDSSKKLNSITETKANSQEEFQISSLLTFMYMSYFLESHPSAIYEWPLLRLKKKRGGNGSETYQRIHPAGRHKLSGQFFFSQYNLVYFELKCP